MVVPDGLSKRAAGLFSALSEQADDAAREALALEAARISDRLDELDSIIAGRGVLELMQFRIPHAFGGGDEVTVEVKFDNVLGEARQQANVLRQILVSLGLGTAEVKKPERRSSVLDELAKRRAARSTRA